MFFASSVSLTQHYIQCQILMVPDLTLDIPLPGDDPPPIQVSLISTLKMMTMESMIVASLSQMLSYQKLLVGAHPICIYLYYTDHK